MDHDKLMELARRAVATGLMSWPAGMRVHTPQGGHGTILDGGKDAVIWWGEGPTREGGGMQDPGEIPDGLLPDLSEPTTLGGLVFGLLPSLGIKLFLYGQQEMAGGWEDPWGITYLGKYAPVAEVAVMALEAHSERVSG